MFGSSSSESAERSLGCEAFGVFPGLGQSTTRYNSSLQSNVTSTTLGKDTHPEDLTFSPEDGIELAIVDVEADGTGEPDNVDGRGDSEDGFPLQSVTRQILGIALPAMVSNCVDPLMSAVDTMYIGRLDPELGGGAVGLGALGINTNVFFLSFFAFGFLATVPTPFVASARARGDEVGASRYCIKWAQAAGMDIGAPLPQNVKGLVQYAKKNVLARLVLFFVH